MAEHDNTGFPLLYCLLSTATTIDLGKQTKALTAWAKCLKDKYSVNPKFVHVDKDMAEIRMARVVWNAKISLHFAGGIYNELSAHSSQTESFLQPHTMLHVHAQSSCLSISTLNQRAKPTQRSSRAHANADNSKQASATTTTAASSSTATLPQIPRVMFVLPQSSNPTPKAATKPTLTNAMNTLCIRVSAQKILQVQPATSMEPGKEN